MTQEQISLIVYSLNFLKSTLTNNHLDSLNLGDFDAVWQKIDNAKKCFEALAASKLNNP